MSNREDNDTDSSIPRKSSVVGVSASVSNLDLHAICEDNTLDTTEDVNIIVDATDEEAAGVALQEQLPIVVASDGNAVYSQQELEAAMAQAVERQSMDASMSQVVQSQDEMHMAAGATIRRTSSQPNMRVDPMMQFTLRKGSMKSMKEARRSAASRASAGSVGARSNAESVGSTELHHSGSMADVKRLRRTLSLQSISSKLPYSKSRGVESFDYDAAFRDVVARNSVMLAEYASGHDGVLENENTKTLKKGAARYARAVFFNKLNPLQFIIKWGVTALLGAVMALTAMGVFVMIEQMVGYKYKLALYLIEGKDLYWAGVLWTLSISVLLGFSAVGMVVWIEPAASGSGIPEVKAYLNGNIIPGLLRFRTLVVKILGLVFAVAAGLFVGPEGPLIHMGTILGTGISHGKSHLFKINLQPLSFLRTHKMRLSFMMSGAAAGVSAAFLSPVGAVIFAYEETSSFWSSDVQMQVLFCSMCAYSTFSIIANSNLTGDVSGFLGFPRGHAGEGWQWHNIPLFCLIGVGGGFFGALFNAINGTLMRERSKYLKGKRFLKALETVLFVIATNLLIFTVPLIFSCQKKPSYYDHHTYHLVKLICGEKEYNDMATLLFTSPHHVLWMLFDDNEEQILSKSALAVHFLIAFFVTAFTIGIAVPSGLFVPTLLVGALYGRFFGEALHLILPSNSVAHPGVWGLFGASAMMAGMSRMTVSVVVILTEISNDFTFLLPIMLIVMVAKWVGDRFNEPLYEIQIKIKQMLYLEANTPYAMTTVTVAEAMKSPVICIRSVENVERIYTLLATTKHNGYPVKSHDDRLVGIIRRDILMIILEQRAFTSVEEMEQGHATLMHPQEFLALIDKGVKHLDIKQMEPTPAEKTAIVDVRFYMDDSPLFLNIHTPLDKAYKMFRIMGMRHMCAVDDKNQCVGILTRYDMHEWFEHLHHDNHLSWRDILCWFERTKDEQTGIKGSDSDESEEEVQEVGAVDDIKMDSKNNSGAGPKLSKKEEKAVQHREISKKGKGSAPTVAKPPIPPREYSFKEGVPPQAIEMHSIEAKQSKNHND